MWFKKRNLRPTSKDVIRRLVILKHVVAYALTSPPRDILENLVKQWDDNESQKFIIQAQAERDKFWQGLRDIGLWQYLSPREQEYAASTFVTMTSQQQVDASWQMESIQTLMWALDLLPQLPSYDTMANHDLIKKIPSSDISGLMRSAHLRNQMEIDRARDIAEFWHWRGRTRELIERGELLQSDEKMKAAGFHTFEDIIRFSAHEGAKEGTIPACIDDDFPVRGKAYRDLTEEEWSEVKSITIERHYAFNWLCGYAPSNRWDETPTDT